MVQAHSRSLHFARFRSASVGMTEFEFDGDAAYPCFPHFSKSGLPPDLWAARTFRAGMSRLGRRFAPWTAAAAVATWAWAIPAVRYTAEEILAALDVERRGQECPRHTSILSIQLQGLASSWFLRLGVSLRIRNSSTRLATAVAPIPIRPFSKVNPAPLRFWAG
jgi:hypothetical protein